MPPRFPLDAAVGLAAGQRTARSTKAAEAWIVGTGPTMTGFLCVVRLCLLMASEGERASPSDLADLVGTSRANMTRILGMLVEDGFAVREAEALDGRRYTIRITAAGKDAARRSVAHLAGPLQRAFSGLSDEELDRFEALLRKCVLSFSDNASPFRAAEAAAK